MPRPATRRHPVVLALVVGLVASLVALAGRAEAAPPTYVVVGDDPAVTGDQWGLHEAYFSDLRGVLTNAANFGDGGVVDATFTIGTARAVPLTSSSLDGVDVYFISARDIAPTEVPVLQAFVQRGGAIVVNSNAPGFFDTTSWLGFTLSPRVVYGDGGAPYTTTHRAPSPSSAITGQTSHPIFAGPFGTATTFENWHSVAGFTAKPSQATNLARTTLTGPDTNGSSNFITITNVTTLAVIPAGAYGAGSGPIIATSDVDTFSNAYTTALGYGTSDALCTLNGTTNGTIARNAFAWIAAQKASIGPPAATTTTTTTVAPSTTTTRPPTTTAAATTSTTSTTSTTRPPTTTVVTTTTTTPPVAPRPIAPPVPARCASADLSPPALAASPTPPLSRYIPMSPVRLLDTRAGGDAGYVCPGQTITVPVAGHAGVPVSGASAVVLNVTGVVTGGEGFLTVWPAGRARPTASNLNFTGSMQQRPNLVLVPLGANGAVHLFAQSGAHVIIDVEGWFGAATTATAGRFTPVTPSRVLDTRTGTGAPAAKPGAGASLTVPVTGRGGVPGTGVAAVVLNATAAEASAGGYVTLWPSGRARPEASNLNLTAAGDTTANLVIVPVGADGAVQLFTETGAHLIADVVGWFGDESQPSSRNGLFQPLTPARVFDTRAGARLGAGGTTTLPYTGVAGIPLTDVAAVAANVTATDAGAPGFVTLWPAGRTRPNVSTLNLAQAGDTRANAALLPLGDFGSISHFVERGAHLLVDASGYFTGPAI